MGKRDYDADINNPWYTVSFTGYLSDGLNWLPSQVLTIMQISVIRIRSFQSILVPCLYAEDLEKEAEKFLNKYCRHKIAVYNEHFTVEFKSGIDESLIQH